MRLTIGTANTLRTLSTRDFERALDVPLAAKPDVLGLNEAAGRKIVRPGYSLYHPALERAQSQNPILVRDGVFEVLGSGSRMLHPKDQIDTVDYPARWATWVELRHLGSGRRVTAIETHADSHVEAGGRLLKLPRVKDWLHMVTELGQIADGFGGQVFVSGDLNFAYRRVRTQPVDSPTTLLAPAGLVPSYQALGAPLIGSHGSRLIDYVFARRSPRLRFVSQRLLLGSPSDHKPLLVTFDLA